MTRKQHQASRKPVPAPVVAAPSRIARIDALRGAAICAMIVYHFAFDLNWFRVFAARFQPRLVWLAFRALIVSAFLLLVGVSLAVAQRAGHIAVAILAAHRADRRMRAAGHRGQAMSSFRDHSSPSASCTASPSSSILAWPLVALSAGGD